MDVSSLLALHTGRSAGWKYAHRVRELGRLQVASGRLEASDPFVNLGMGLEVAIPAGSYPALVTVADVSDGQDGSHLRESYLSIVIAEGVPARVEYLAPDGAEPLSDPDAFYGVAVDAGTVAFADAEAVARCMPPGDWYQDVFDNGHDDSWFALMDSPTHFAEGCANIVLPAATAGENVVLSHSGWGDGLYPVLGVYDSAGRLLAVHIDLLVEEPEDGHPGAPVESAAVSEPQVEAGFWRRLLGPRK